MNLIDREGKLVGQLWLDPDNCGPLTATLVVTAVDGTPYETSFAVEELRAVAEKNGASFTKPEKPISSLGSHGSNVLVTLRGDGGPIYCSGNWGEFGELVRTAAEENEWPGTASADAN